jgi:hypothetical protein
MPVRSRSVPLLVGLALLTHTSLGWANPADDKSTKSGTLKVREACGISWHTAVPAALEQAATKKGEKPVMVLRVLGDLDGFM